MAPAVLRQGPKLAAVGRVRSDLGQMLELGPRGGDGKFDVTAQQLAHGHGLPVGRKVSPRSMLNVMCES
ncbi:MAG: hypothetical protein JWO49_555 [Arthrobacter sp.]|nr:hypothetical protein [Arthrobacter sp.]